MNPKLGRRAGWLAAALSVGGGLALANRLLLLDDLPPTLPGATHDWMWRGWRVRYTTMGSGPSIVLVHSVHAAASSFEMRNIFEPLSHRQTVYALDLPGFGKSERPASTYSGVLYAALLADFLAEVVKEPATVLASSLSAAYGLAAARERPDLVRQLCLISPTLTTSHGAAGRAFGWLLALPLVGTAAFNVLVSQASIQSYLRRAYGNSAFVDDPLVGQQWATSHQPNARLAPAAFVAGALDLPDGGQTAETTIPILVLRGSRPGIGRQMADADLRALGPQVTIETIQGAGQLPHDEAPDQVLAILERWMCRWAAT